MTKLRLTKVQTSVNPFVIHNRRFSRYAGECSGAQRRLNVFERDSYIVYYHKLGVSFTELALELHIDRTTAGRAYQRHMDIFMALWGKLSYWAAVAKRKYLNIVQNSIRRAQVRKIFETACRARTLFTKGLGVAGFSFSRFLCTSALSGHADDALTGKKTPLRQVRRNAFSPN